MNCSSRDEATVCTRRRRVCSQGTQLFCSRNPLQLSDYTGLAYLRDQSRPRRAG